MTAARLSLTRRPRTLPSISEERQLLSQSKTKKQVLRLWHNPSHQRLHFFAPARVAGHREPPPVRSLGEGGSGGGGHKAGRARHVNGLNTRVKNMAAKWSTLDKERGAGGGGVYRRGSRGIGVRGCGGGRALGHHGLRVCTGLRVGREHITISRLRLSVSLTTHA